MKNKTTILFGVTLAVVAGLFGTGIFGVTITKTDQTDPFATALFTGHVTTILKDSDGNIKAYRQSDNIIVNQGENCALKLLFSNGTGAAGRGVATTGGTVCTGENQFGYRFIEIGNVSAAFTAGLTPASPISTDARLYASHNNTNSAGDNPGLLRKLSSISTTGWSNSTSAVTANAASVVMSATFTNGAATAATHTVNESGLFNVTINAAGGAQGLNGLNSHQQDSMFARQVFSTILMQPADSLTVQWTINVGGTAAIT